MPSARPSVTLDLLGALDAFVHAARDLPDIRGTVCIAVIDVDTGYASWWRARFGTEMETETTSRPPVEADTVLVLGADEAAHVLRGRLPDHPKLLLREGNERLLRQFLSAFLTRRTWLEVRARARRKGEAA